MKIKRKMRTIIKKYDGETYIFKNGVAIVPGVHFPRGIPMKITLQEFNQLSKES